MRWRPDESAQSSSSVGRPATCVLKSKTNALKILSANTEHSPKRWMSPPFSFTLSTGMAPTPAAPDSIVERPAPAPSDHRPRYQTSPRLAPHTGPTSPAFHSKPSFAENTDDSPHRFDMSARTSHGSGPNLKPRLIIHGGAGNLSLSYPPEVYDHYRTSLVTIVPMPPPSPHLIEP